MSIIKQRHSQIYITCQLHVSANIIGGGNNAIWIWYSITIGISLNGGGRDIVYERVGGRVCRRFNMSRHVTRSLWNHRRNITCTDQHIKPSAHTPSNSFVNDISSLFYSHQYRWLYCIIFILRCFLRQLYPTWWLPKTVLAETCSWYVMYNWQYSCVMTVMSMHNCFLMSILVLLLLLLRGISLACVIVRRDRVFVVFLNPSQKNAHLARVLHVLNPNFILWQSDPALQMEWCR